jgi:AraC-like DNA-binding protein
MARTIPLLRAAAFKPFIDVAASAGVPVCRRMDDAGFCGFPWEDQERPIPVLPVLAFLRAVAERDGLTDLGYRAAFPGGLAALGRFGRFALAGRTPKEVLQRVARAMPTVFLHQQVVVETGPDGPRVRFTLPRAFDDHAVALVFQYNATVVAGFVAAAAPESTPLPRIAAPLACDRYGPGKLPCEWLPAPPNTLVLDLAADAADRPYARADASDGKAPLGALVTEGDVATVTRNAIDLLLDETMPSLARIARATGLSVRTLQRELALEGTSFNALLDEVRQERALAAIRQSGASMAVIAAELGYTNQASLSRSVRRWTGETPRSLRAELGSRSGKPLAAPRTVEAHH